jgi:hypothetical protein
VKSEIRNKSSPQIWFSLGRVRISDLDSLRSVPADQILYCGIFSNLPPSSADW